MLKLRKVAVTGGIASGKSTVCKILSELGAEVINADKIVHKLLNPETNLGQKVIELFGDTIVVDDKIDRQRIAAQAFHNPKKLRMLEALIHPKVYEEIEKCYQDAMEKGAPLFVVEIPLLFESGGEEFFDQTIAVVAPIKECSERFKKSTGYEQEEFDRRQAFQLSQEEKKKRAGLVIENNGSLNELKQKVTEIYNKEIKI
jgi:dephospho-CoA kinase